MTDRPIVVITGSRTLKDKTAVIRAFDQARFRTRFSRYRAMKDALWLHGRAAGVDAILVAHLEIDLRLDVEAVPPDYTAHGMRAPLIRNTQMVNRALAAPHGAVIAVWDGQSPGTQHCIRMAARRRLPIAVEVIYPND